MLIGGYLVDYFGKIRMLNLYLGIITFVIAVFAFSTNLWSNTTVIYGFILIYYTLCPFLNIAIFRAGLLGILKLNFSWEYIFLLISILPVIMAFMMQFINFTKHKIKVGSFTILNKVLMTPQVIKG
jgi:PAT family beta-lactamase induction signal transducer AmpG